MLLLVVAYSVGQSECTFEDKTTMSKQILVVEDHGVLLELLGRSLTLRGWNTILAGSGVEALKKLEDYLPNVILTDMRMPAMNGIELVQILKGHPVYRNIPILAVSGASSRQVRQQCLTAGCDDFIAKPFAISVVDKALMDLVSAERQNRYAGSDSTT
jgi:two-component system cell cycle response regulator DivK